VVEELQAGEALEAREELQEEQQVRLYLPLLQKSKAVPPKKDDR